MQHPSSTSVRLRLARRFGVLVACALALVPKASFGQLEMALRGHVIDPMECAENPSQTYALYLPSAYTPDRRWPIVYCFDPLARGRLPVDRLRAAAERRGYILVGSDNSRNGLMSAAFAAANALLADTQRRFAVDPARIYVAGFSGGARASIALAEAGRFAGVFASGGGFPSTVPVEIPFVFFGAAGRTDFNYAEMIGLGPELDRRKVPNRFVIFEGSHEWPPENVFAEALAWFDLQAMRRGTLPRDDAAVGTQFRERVATAAALTAQPDEMAAAYRAILADFGGWVDTGEIAARLGALEKTREYRKAAAARAAGLRDEASWRERLLEALSGGEREEPGYESPFRDNTGGTRVMLDRSGEQDPDAERRTAESWERFQSRVPLETREDSFAAVRRLAADLRRRSPKNPAAARALGGVFVSCLTDGAALFDAGKFAAAARAYEAATLLRPEVAFSYFEWARTSLELGDRRRARELLETATAKGYDDGDRVAALRARLDPRPALAMQPLPTPTPPALAPARAEAPRVVPSAADQRAREATREEDPREKPFARADAEPSAIGGRASAVGGVGERPGGPVSEGVRKTAASGSSAARPDAPEVVALTPMRVAGAPIGSFGISLRVFAIRATRQINRIVIHDVVDHSDAAGAGINPGDEIVRVDGRSIYSLTADFDRDSDFGRLFIARKPGDRIVLDLVTTSGAERRVTLTEGGDPRPPWLRWR